MFLLLAFVLGIALRSFVPVSIIFIWVGAVLGVAVASIGIFQKQKAIVVYGFLFLAFLSGVFRFAMIENIKPDLAEFYGQPNTFHGIIVEEPERTDKVQRLKAEITGQPRFYTLITIRRYPEFKIGDDLKIQGVLQKPENYSDFDYVSYLAKNDIYSTFSFPLIEKTGESKGNKLKIFLSRAKHSFEKNIDIALPEPHASFLKGLLLGERESLPQELVEDFNRTGTTHIVALSGYNITLVGRFFTEVLLFLTIPFYVSFWLATAAIILFIMLTGASPSVVRAGIMGILVLVANREGRPYHMTNALALAGAAMIFQNPKILRFDAAFQLSFLATLGLVYLSPRISALLSRFKDNKIKQILVETLSAQIMVLPLLIYLFGRVSLISPITNILVLLAVPYSMATGFITGMLGFLWSPLGQASGFVTWVLLEYKIRTIELLAKLPFVSVSIGIWGLIPVAFLYGFLFLRLKRKT